MDTNDHISLATVRLGRERTHYALTATDAGFECVKRREGTATWQRVWRLPSCEAEAVKRALARLRWQHRPGDVTLHAAEPQWRGEGVG